MENVDYLKKIRKLQIEFQFVFLLVLGIFVVSVINVRQWIYLLIKYYYYDHFSHWLPFLFHFFFFFEKNSNIFVYVLTTLGLWMLQLLGRCFPRWQHFCSLRLTRGQFCHTWQWTWFCKSTRCKVPTPPFYCPNSSCKSKMLKQTQLYPVCVPKMSNKFETIFETCEGQIN